MIAPKTGSGAADRAVATAVAKMNGESIIPIRGLEFNVLVFVFELINWRSMVLLTVAIEKRNL